MRRFVLIIAVMLACSPVLGTAAAAPAHDPSFDLPAVVLTTADLESAGFTGYRIDTASPFDQASDAAYVSEYQNLDLETVTQGFADAGEQGSYFTESSIRTNPDDRTSQPVRGIETGAFLFADEAGAKAGYRIITDESNLNNATSLDAGQGLGDASEMTLLTLRKDPVYGIPTTQLELEIRIGRLVLTLSTFDFEPDTAGTTNYKPDEPANLEALGNLFIDRANAALSGKSPGLAPLLLPVESSVTQAPYRIYNLVDADPIQESFESDQALQARVGRQHDRGTTSSFFNSQLLHSADATAGEIWFYTNIYQFESAKKASDYLQTLVDLMSQDSRYSSVTTADTPDLGDEALMLTLGLRGDSGADTQFNQLFIRQGAIVAVLWITENPLTPDSPLVSVDALEQLGAAEAACLDARFCDAAVPLPDEIVAMMNGSSPDASPTGKPKLPDASSAGTPTEDELLARVETFDNLSQQHTEGSVEYDQNPPVGGMHSPVLQNCGFYDAPVGNEHAVHSLEHGAVWITYDPDLPASDVAKLEALAEGHGYLLISPYEGLPAPIVASAWGVQLQLDGVDDPYLTAFIDFYEQGPQTPEPGAACSGGTSETVG